MLNSQNLINKICAKIACGGLTSLETCQTTGALNILSNPVFSVATFSALPNPITYAGRLIYVDDENRYYHAVDGFWLNKLDSEVFVYNIVAQTKGTGTSGQLGNNQAVNATSAVSVVGGFTDWCQVSAGDSHNLGLRTNGTVWAWGSNFCGRLGDNCTVNISSPVSVVGGFTDWCQVSAGNAHNLALRTNGTAWAWGYNTCGRLGDNTIINRSSPVSVVGGFTDWCQISAGYQHNLAVRQNGTAWAWGNGLCGRLGDNCTVNRSSPVSVVGEFTDWCQVSAGGQHSLGLRTNGTAWAWGNGFYGRLGDGTTTCRSSPVSVVGGFTDWCQVSAGGIHNLAIRTDGTLWSWGFNSAGQLGDNSVIQKQSPVSVVGGFTNWCQVSASKNTGGGATGCSSFGIRTNGTLWGWGYNGLLIINCVSGSKSSPVPVVEGFTDWCQINHHTGTFIGIRSIKKGF